MGRNMTLKEYEIHKSTILTANDSNDKEALKQIQKQLVAQYGLDSDDVKRLLGYFRYNV